MQMAFTDDFGEVLGEIQDEQELCPGVFDWNGTAYACTANGATRGGRLESYGWAVDEDLVIIVRAALFGAAARPVKGQTVIYRDATYRIDRVLTAPGDSFLRLACVNASRGA